jgi:hypothetical protein
LLIVRVFGYLVHEPSIVVEGEAVASVGIKKDKNRTHNHKNRAWCHKCHWKGTLWVYKCLNWFQAIPNSSHFVKNVYCPNVSISVLYIVQKIMVFLFGVLFESFLPERFYVKIRNSHWKSFAPAAIIQSVGNNWNHF